VKRARRRGFTLVEIMIASTVVLILLGGGYMVVNMAGTVYKRISGHEDGALQLKRASRHLYMDILQAFFDHVKVEVVPGAQSDAVGMMSAQVNDDARGGFIYDQDGAPLWQRNVIYYLANSNADTCTLAPNSDGVDDVCPHKMLIRKCVDTGDPNDPTDDPVGPPRIFDLPEQTLVSLQTYLTRPNGFSTANMASEPFLTNAEIISTNLLSMKVELVPDPNFPREVRIELKAFNALASSNTNVGSSSLGQHPKTITHLVSVFPRNVE
jgi:prepilin-type N-terminal cleavage/methylation domain-containing protein